MRAWKRWLFKCQLPQDLWVLAVEKAQSDLLLFLPVGIRGKWAGATGNSRLGWFGGLWSPWLHGGRKVSVSWALQRLANVDYTTFTRRKDVIPTFCCCCFWSCLIMCGWKEDKVYSALLYASERQLRRKACLHMSGKAEVNLDWSWTQKGVGVVLCSPALRDSTNGLIIALTSCLLFFFFERYCSVSSASCPLRNMFNSLQLPWFCLSDTICLYPPALQSHSQLLGWGHSTSGIGDFLQSFMFPWSQQPKGILKRWNFW